MTDTAIKDDAPKVKGEPDYAQHLRGSSAWASLTTANSLDIDYKADGFRVDHIPGSLGQRLLHAAFVILEAHGYQATGQSMGGGLVVRVEG